MSNNSKENIIYIYGTGNLTLWLLQLIALNSRHITELAGNNTFITIYIIKLNAKWNGQVGEYNQTKRNIYKK